MEIKLNGKNGGYALVSKKDYTRVSKYNWYIDADGYVHTFINGKGIKLHRYIKNAPPNVLVDHINGHGYDNRRSNLRLSNVIKNAQNVKKREGASSKFRGVCYVTKTKKYRAQIKNLFN